MSLHPEIVGFVQSLNVPVEGYTNKDGIEISGLIAEEVEPFPIDDPPPVPGRMYFTVSTGECYMLYRIRLDSN